MTYHLSEPAREVLAAGAITRVVDHLTSRGFHTVVIHLEPNRSDLDVIFPRLVLVRYQSGRVAANAWQPGDRIVAVGQFVLVYDRHGAARTAVNAWRARRRDHVIRADLHTSPASNWRPLDPPAWSPDTTSTCSSANAS